MSNLKSAEINCSPFPYYAQKGDIFESQIVNRWWKVTDIEGGIIYWIELESKPSSDEVTGFCNLP